MIEKERCKRYHAEKMKFFVEMFAKWVEYKLKSDVGSRSKIIKK